MNRKIAQPVLLVLLIVILTTVGLTQEPEKEEPKVRYVTRSSTTNNNKPKINFVRKKNLSKTAGKTVVNKLKPTDYKLEKKVFRLINKKRKEKNIHKLKWNSELASVAREHSENMAKYKFFSHIGRNGRMIDQRAIDFGLKDWRSIGENIAYNKGFTNPGEFSVNRWMLSSSHSKNLLSENWKESGVGIAITEDGTYFFTQVFMVN